MKLKKDETIIVAYATYKSRKHRDQVMKKVLADPFMTSGDPNDYPFDAKRMFWGGFKPIVDL
ncbi:hypothetical protein D3C83_316870 [compost metagenome]